VRWLLTQSGSERWTYQTLFEALRRQPAWVNKRPGRVADAAALAQRHSVKQRGEKRGQWEIVRLERTDQDAPIYPKPSKRRGHRRK